MLNRSWKRRGAFQLDVFLRLRRDAEESDPLGGEGATSDPAGNFVVINHKSWSLKME
jgi:hypothetical protein